MSFVVAGTIAALAAMRRRKTDGSDSAYLHGTDVLGADYLVVDQQKTDVAPSQPPLRVITVNPPTPFYQTVASQVAVGLAVMTIWSAINSFLGNHKKSIL